MAGIHLSFRNEEISNITKARSHIALNLTTATVLLIIDFCRILQSASLIDCSNFRHWKGTNFGHPSWKLCNELWHSSHISITPLHRSISLDMEGTFDFDCYSSRLERTYKPHYHYQKFSPLGNGTDLNREKYAILQTHWHQNWSVMELKYP